MVLLTSIRMENEMTSEIDVRKCGDLGVSVLTVRWIARVIGIFLLLIFLVIPTLVHGGRNLIPIFMDGSLMDFIFNYTVLIMLFGLIVAWRREGFGGVLLVGGWVVIAILMVAFKGPFRLTLIFGAFLIPGFLYLFCWWNTRKARSKT